MTLFRVVLKCSTMLSSRLAFKSTQNIKRCYKWRHTKRLDKFANLEFCIFEMSKTKSKLYATLDFQSIDQIKDLCRYFHECKIVVETNFKMNFSIEFLPHFEDAVNWLKSQVLIQKMISERLRFGYVNTPTRNIGIANCRCT